MKRGRMKCSPGETRVDIRYYAVPNTNTHKGGYMPVYRVGKREHGDTYGRGHDLDTAVKQARSMAMDEASRYRGDYCVSVTRSARGRRR